MQLPQRIAVYDPSPDPNPLLVGLSDLVMVYCNENREYDSLIVDAKRLAWCHKQLVTLEQRTEEERQVIDKLCAALTKHAPDGYAFAEYANTGYYMLIKQKKENSDE